MAFATMKFPNHYMNLFQSKIHTFYIHIAETLVKLWTVCDYERSALSKTSIATIPLQAERATRIQELEEGRSAVKHSLLDKT